MLGVIDTNNVTLRVIMEGISRGVTLSTGAAGRAQRHAGYADILSTFRHLLFGLRVSVGRLFHSVQPDTSKLLSWNFVLMRST